VKLLFFSPHYGTVGGVQLIIDAIAERARAAGHVVAAVVDGNGASAPGTVRELSLYPFPPRARELDRLRRFAQRFPMGAARLIAAVRAADPDVVSVHCVRRFGPYVAALRRATRIPQVLSLQEGALPADTPQNVRLFRMLVGAADVVAACSQEAATYARREGGARRAEVVPNGFAPAEFTSSATFPHPRPYIAGIGRLEAQKGFDVLIDALPRLGRTDVDVLLAGEGTARAALEARSRTAGVIDRVRFLGALNRARIVALLRSAAAVACPSRFEGLPLVCVEALAAERPVVASAVNGTPEIIRHGETGLLVPPDDPAALAAALTRLLGDPVQAGRLAARGRALVERDYAWPRLAARYVDLCVEAAGPGVATATA
jgi:glycosyltransferase involved in cell wall biosynthesis